MKPKSDAQMLDLWSDVDTRAWGDPSDAQIDFRSGLCPRFLGNQGDVLDMADQDSVSPSATRRAYDRLSKVYDALADSNEHVAREAGQDALDVQPGERVLEIGYGPGRALVHFARAVGASGKVCGIDLSPGMADVARKTLAQESIEQHVQLDIGDARQLPYDDGSFDAVFMSFTLELFELDEILAVLTEVRRVLRPGGRLGVVSMATSESASALTKVYKWFHKHFPHFVDCQPIDAKRFLEEAGFQITSRKDMEIWTLPVVALVGRRGEN